MDGMTPSLSALRSLAKAATPGPWGFGKPAFNKNGKPWRVAVTNSSGTICNTYDAGTKPFNGLAPTASANAAFIAACSPEVILALIGEVEELRKATR